MNTTTTKPARLAFSTTSYETSHMKKPRGFGRWAFCPYPKRNAADYLDHTLFFSGTLGEAKKALALHCAKTGNDMEYWSVMA